MPDAKFDSSGGFSIFEDMISLQRKVIEFGK